MLKNSKHAGYGQINQFDFEKQNLLKLLKEKSYEKKKVILSSGKESDFYIDCRIVTMSSEGQSIIGKICLWKLHEFNNKSDPYVGVGGLTMGADPIAYAICRESLMPAFVIRKEAKKHSNSNLIEGLKNLPRGRKLLLVDDVLTTGKSILEASKVLREAGFVCDAAIVLVDRCEGGKENLKENNIETYSILTRRDFENYYSYVDRDQDNI